jgi:lysophospholipase L1-like esterase
MSGYRDAKGNPSRQFGPSISMSYAELAKIAGSLAGKPPTTETPKNRSARGQWAAGYIKAAEDMHLSVFTPSLNVNRPASRGAVVQTLLEALGAPLVPASTSFQDVPATGPYARAIATAVKLGLIRGDTDMQGRSRGTFRPDAPIGRAEVATILSQILAGRANGPLPAAGSPSPHVSLPASALPQSKRRGGGGGEGGGTGGGGTTTAPAVSVSTTTSLVLSANPSTYGQSVTFTATVSDAHATGTVTFLDGSTTIATCTLSSGTCSPGVSSLSVGSHSLSAVYGGDGTYLASTSNTVTQTVNQVTTTTALASGTNPSTYSNSITLTGTVSPTTATGTLTFKDGSTTIGTATLGHASGTLAIAILRAGSHSLTAIYGGNVTHSGSTSAPLTQTVNKANPVATLASSLNPSTFGTGVTLTATLSTTTGTGTITFKDGTTTIGTATVGHGSGSLAISSLRAGTHSLTAVYGGDTNYNSATSNTVTQTVNKASSATTLTSSLNPSTYGSGVTLKATVSPSTATGTVTFKDGSTTLGTATLGHGSGTLAISTLGVGSHSLTAVYGGNANYLTSTSSTLTQTVNTASTTTALTSSLNPSTFGSGVTLTATVTSSSATGSITFKDGSTTLGTATLGHGSGSYTTTTLSVGSHSLTAVYAGNSNYATSTSSTVTQTVNKASSSTTLASGTNPSTYGNSITLTATISPSTGTGTITFKDGSATIGTAPIGHGSGSLAISTLGVGSHSLTAVYGGDTNNLTSTSNTVTQTVNSNYPSITLINTPSWSSNIPSVLSGVSSLTFNGTSQYGTSSDIGLPIGNNSFSVSWWQNSSDSSGAFGAAWSWGASGNAVIGGMYQNKLVIHDADGLVLESPASVNDGAWHHMCVTYDGTTIRLYLDGTQVATQVYALSTVRNGNFRIASSIGVGNYFNGSLTDTRVYGTALSAGDVTTLAGGGSPSSSPIRKYAFSEGTGTTLANSGVSAVTGQLICDGNSLTFGTGSSNPTAESYPAQLVALLGTSWAEANYGVPGQSAELMNSDATTQIDPLFDSQLPKNIVIAWEGIGSINNANDTAAQAYAAMTTYIQGRQAAGFKVIVLTTMKWGTITAPKEVIRQAYNALVLANSAGADAVVDVASDSRLSDPTNTTYFNGDTVHLTDAGYAVVAGLVRPAVLAQ